MKEKKKKKKKKYYHFIIKKNDREKVTIQEKLNLKNDLAILDYQN